MATNVALEIAKAGWLHRRSTVLHRWKKNWFVLYRDGLLRYFESPESPRAEEVFVLRSACARVKTGAEVQPVQPPDGVSSAKACMLELEMRDGAHLVLCAESMDDMKAWQYALEEARTLTDPHAQAGYARTVPISYAPTYVPTYAPYPYGMTYDPFVSSGYPGRVLSAPAQVYQTPNGTTTILNPQPTQVVYVDDSPSYYGRRYRRGYGGPYVGTGVYPFFW